MEKKTCETCMHFRQHYSLREGLLFRVHCGHCTILHRRRTRRPDSVACDKYSLAPPEENSCVNKQYLSKRLLNYWMQLELLPEIKAEEDSESLPCIKGGGRNF